MDTQNSVSIITSATFVILAVLGVVIVYKFMDNELGQRYQQIAPTTRRQLRDIKHCPRGCVRGSCRYRGMCYDPFPPNPSCCVFDQQCRFCKDKTGIIVDKPSRGNSNYIDENYYKKFKDVVPLNRRIKEENNYIARLNRKIRRENESLFTLKDSRRRRF